MAAISPPESTKSPTETSSNPCASMTRSSTPSNRPQTSSTPGPSASCRARAWLNGAPRGDINSFGTSVADTAAIASDSTSGLITMPAPPPNGASSTVPWRSLANRRISTASSAHTPSVNARPARLSPSGPGNISGKSVSAVARHTSALVLLLGRAACEQTRRRRDHNLAALDVDLGHRLVGEGQHHSARHLHHRPGAEIVEGHYLPPIPAVRADRLQTDQIGLVPLPIAGARQALALHVEPQTPQCLGRRAIGYALDPGQDHAACGAEGLDPVLLLPRFVR